MLVGMFVLGLIVGVALTTIIFGAKSIGDLRVDQSDPDDGPYLFLELKERPDFIKRKKFVILSVKVKNFISQK